MSRKTNPEPQQPPSTFDKLALEITRQGGAPPSRSVGPGAWDQFAAGVRNGLADFVGRVLLGETPGDKDKGLDR